MMDDSLLERAVREVRRSGEVPVLVILGDTVVSTTLSRITGGEPDAVSFGWSMGAIGEACVSARYRTVGRSLSREQP